MTDYHPLITRAVEGLDRNAGEARRALYERARAALVAQLRAVEPPLSESDITRERLALEDAIRKVEAEAARKSRTELRGQLPAAAPRRDRLGQPADGGRPEARRSEQATPRPSGGETADVHPERQAPTPTARERILSARVPSAPRDGARAFRETIGGLYDLNGPTTKAAPPAREGRVPHTPLPFPPAKESITTPDEADELSSFADAEPQFDSNEPNYGDDAWRESRRHEPAHVPEDEHDLLRSVRHAAQATEHAHLRPPRSYRGLIQLAVVLIILAGFGATISWQWPHIRAAYSWVTQIGSRQPSPPAREATAQPKSSDRVPQERPLTQTPAQNTASQTGPAVAQRVVLYEEDPNDPQGKRSVGSVIWRTETVSPGPGLAPELAVRADVTIPERHIAMTWSLRRNTDQALPATHTIEVTFTLPADFPGGGIANVPGILMKQSEQARGVPLAGLAVKVTNGFFLIGLSSVTADVQRNVELLKDRSWFDIPVVYTNGGRAILAMEKGPPGDRAFADAFAAWEKK